MEETKKFSLKKQLQLQPILAGHLLQVIWLIKTMKH
jgi:hypothetical protein